MLCLSYYLLFIAIQPRNLSVQPRWYKNGRGLAAMWAWPNILRALRPGTRIRYAIRYTGNCPHVTTG